MTGSPHKHKLAENNDRERKINAEKRAMKVNIAKTKISISTSSSSIEDEEIELILVSTCEEGSLSTADISSQRIKEKKNVCPALKDVTVAMRSVQANVKTGLISPEVTVLTASDL
jgi:hypothetical protein